MTTPVVEVVALLPQAGEPIANREVGEEEKTGHKMNQSLSVTPASASVHHLFRGHEVQDWARQSHDHGHGHGARHSRTM